MDHVFARDNIDLNYYLTRLSEALQEAGEKKEAAMVLDTLADGLAARKAAAWVVDQVKGLRAALGVALGDGATPRARKTKPASSEGRGRGWPSSLAPAARRI